MDLKEEEYNKKRWQEYTEELSKLTQEEIENLNRLVAHFDPEEGFLISPCYS